MCGGVGGQGPQSHRRFRPISARADASARASTSRTGTCRAAAAAAASSNSTFARPARDLHPDRCARRRRRSRPCAAAGHCSTGVRPHAERAGLGGQHGRRRRRRAGSTRAATVWAGRPFFITIGVTQASWAPASRRRAMVWASTSPVTSSTFASSSTTGCLGRPRAAAAVADERPGRRSGGRRARGRRRRSRWPSTVMAGTGPNDAASVRTRATPVGVASSSGDVDADDGEPSSSRAVAGAGTGRCAVGGGDGAVAGGDRASTRPRRRRAPRGRRTSRRRRRWRRGRRPRGSARRRAAVRCSAPSTSARAAKAAWARSRTRSGSAASASSVRIVAQVRWWCGPRAPSTTARVAAIPPRSTGSASRRPAVDRQPRRRAPGPRRGRRRRRAARRAACRRRRREKQSTQPIRTPVVTCRSRRTAQAAP